ncbi:MAG: response regulator transcription factor [Bacteroidota bacterium]|nr:response regulator transcription factor [Bacteroidota bacterium]
MEEKIHILLADDHQYMLDGFVMHLNNFPFVESVTTATSGDELPEIEEKRDFDLVITDIEMPGKSGIDVCHLIRKRNPKQKIIIVTGFAQSDYIRAVLRCEPNAVLDKVSIKDHIEKAINDVWNGKKYYSPQIQKIINTILTNKKTERRTMAIPSITPRQKQVLNLIAKGKSNKKIGKKLFITPHAINSHRAVLFDKFDVNNAAALIAKASKFGFLDAE